MKPRESFARLCERWPELGAFAGANVRTAGLSSLGPDAVRERIESVRELDAAAAGFFELLFASNRWRKNPDVLSEWSALLLRQALIAEQVPGESERLADWLASMPRALAHALEARESPDARALELARDAAEGFGAQLDALADLVPPVALQGALLALSGHRQELAALIPGEPLGEVEELDALLAARGIAQAPAELAALFEAEVARLTAELERSPAPAPEPGHFSGDVLREALRTELEVAAEAWKLAGLPGCTARFEVLAVPPGLEASIPHAAVFTPRPLQPQEPALVVLNADSPLAHDSGRRMLLAVHEGAPGHGLQADRANAASAPWRAVDLCPIPGMGAGVYAGELMEGWAHFVEARYAEIFPGDAWLQHAVVREALWRAARARADLGFASGELDADGAARYLQAKAGLSARDALAEVDDFRLNPTYGLSYTLGAVQLRGLRAAARDEAALYERILAQGLVPLSRLNASGA